MNFEGAIGIEADVSAVWQALLHPDCLADCTPGVQEVVQLDDRTFRGTMTATVGPVSGKFSFQSTVVESDPPRQLVVQLHGTDSVTSSRIGATTRIELAPVTGHSTRMSYESNVEVTGRLAILGEMVLRTTAMLVLDEFSRRFRQRLEASTVRASDA